MYGNIAFQGPGGLHAYPPPAVAAGDGGGGVLFTSNPYDYMVRGGVEDLTAAFVPASPGAGDSKKKRTRRGGRKHKRRTDADAEADGRLSGEERGPDNPRPVHPLSSGGSEDDGETGGECLYGEPASPYSLPARTRPPVSIEEAGGEGDRALPRTPASAAGALRKRPTAPPTTTAHGPVAVSGADERNLFANHYKTRLCKVFDSAGVCSYGDRCRFAHGKEQLRTYVQNQRDGLTSEEAVQKFVLSGGLVAMARDYHSRHARNGGGSAGGVRFGVDVDASVLAMMQANACTGDPRALLGHVGMLSSSPPLPVPGFTVSARDARVGLGAPALLGPHVPLSGTLPAHGGETDGGGSNGKPRAVRVEGGTVFYSDGTVACVADLDEGETQRLYRQAMKDQFDTAARPARQSGSSSTGTGPGVSVSVGVKGEGGLHGRSVSLSLDPSAVSSARNEVTEATLRAAEESTTTANTSAAAAAAAAAAASRGLASAGTSGSTHGPGPVSGGAVAQLMRQIHARTYYRALLAGALKAEVATANAERERQRSSLAETVAAGGAGAAGRGGGGGGAAGRDSSTALSHTNPIFSVHPPRPHPAVVAENGGSRSDTSADTAAQGQERFSNEDPGLLIDFYRSIAIAAHEAEREVRELFPQARPILWPEVGSPIAAAATATATATVAAPATEYTDAALGHNAMPTSSSGSHALLNAANLLSPQTAALFMASHGLSGLPLLSGMSQGALPPSLTSGASAAHMLSYPHAMAAVLGYNAGSPAPQAGGGSSGAGAAPAYPFASMLPQPQHQQPQHQHQHQQQQQLSHVSGSHRRALNSPSATPLTTPAPLFGTSGTGYHSPHMPGSQSLTHVQTPPMMASPMSFLPFAACAPPPAYPGTVDTGTVSDRVGNGKMAGASGSGVTSQAKNHFSNGGGGGAGLTAGKEAAESARRREAEFLQQWLGGPVSVLRAQSRGHRRSEHEIPSTDGSDDDDGVGLYDLPVSPAMLNALVADEDDGGS